jgi:hypothetical protein
MIVCDNHMRKAMKVANSSDIIKAKMSALAISRGGGIIATASNRRLTGNYVEWSLHAEAALIKKLNRLCAFDRYRDITIFVFRISSKGVSMAKPCLKCQKMLERYPVKIFYTNASGTIERL